MIKFLKEETVLFENKTNFGNFDSIDSDFKDALAKGNCEGFSFQVGDSKEIDFNKAFFFRVNVKGCCSLECFFPIEGLDKSELIKRVISLKDIKIVDQDSSKAKLIELLKIVEKYKPYFVIFNAKGLFSFEEDEFGSLLKENKFDSIDFLYVSKAEEVEEAVQEASEENEKPEQNSDKSNSRFAMDLEEIKKNKFHFLFLVVSSFLFGFAASIGFCNAMIGKTITILFFVCAGVGLFLDTYVYLDYFKERKIKDRLFVYSLLFNLFGIILSLGATLLFYYLDNSAIKQVVTVKLVVGAGIGMTIGSIVLSIVIAFVIAKIEANRKPKAAPAPVEEVKEENKEENE